MICLNGRTLGPSATCTMHPLSGYSGLERIPPITGGCQGRALTPDRTKRNCRGATHYSCARDGSRMGEPFNIRRQRSTAFKLLVNPRNEQEVAGAGLNGAGRRKEQVGEGIADAAQP